MGAATPHEQAWAILRRGGLVAVPTETVYGLAADAENELAVRRLFAVKGRPAAHPVEERRLVADAIDAVALEVTGIVGYLLTPDLEGQVLEVPAHL